MWYMYMGGDTYLCAYKRQNRVSDPLEMELQVLVGYLDSIMSAGIRT